MSNQNDSRYVDSPETKAADEARHTAMEGLKQAANRIRLNSLVSICHDLRNNLTIDERRTLEWAANKIEVLRAALTELLFRAENFHAADVKFTDFEKARDAMDGARKALSSAVLSGEHPAPETSDDRLKAALWKYGKHLAACALQGDMMGTAICTCGWARIRETLAPGSAVETTPLPRVVDVVEELEKRGDELSVRAARYIRIKLNTLEHTEKAYRALCQKGLAEESGVNGL